MVAYYTGVGSRETPEEVLELMRDVAYRLSRMGLVLRSGKAAGADAAFQMGAQRWHEECGYLSIPPENIAEIYIPWDKFKGGEGLDDRYDLSLRTLDRQVPENPQMREQMAEEVHPVWERLSQGAKKLHERNIHQVFGKDLKNKGKGQSKFLIYYAKESKNGGALGGTATAVNTAASAGIPTLNLYHENNRGVLVKFIELMENRRGIS